MKANRLYLLLSLGSLSGTMLSAQAPADHLPPGQRVSEQVKPAEPPEAKPNDKPERKYRLENHHEDGDLAVPEKRHRTHHYHQGDGPQAKPAMRPATYLGISTRSPSPEARALTGVAEGLGLVVEEVMPDSPAKTAGLQRYDLLTQLDDQLLVNPEQLSTLVRMKQKDTAVTLTLKRAGAEQKVIVKLAEKILPAPVERGPIGQFFDQTFDKEEMRKFGDDLRENMQRFGRDMDQWHNRMKDQWQVPKHKKPRDDKQQAHPKHEGRPEPEFRKEDEA